MSFKCDIIIKKKSELLYFNQWFSMGMDGHALYIRLHQGFFFPLMLGFSSALTISQTYDTMIAGEVSFG